jgi:hypothetical protein
VIHGASEADLPLVPLLQALALVLLANGAPVLATRLFGSFGGAPVDGGGVLADGRPLFGRSKTWRGLALGVTAPTVGAPLLGVDCHVGALLGALAMAGDLASSFLKRRLGVPASGAAPGIDQVPESLLPMLGATSALGLSLTEAVIGSALFWAGEVVLSPILHRLGIRDRPH